MTDQAAQSNDQIDPRDVRFVVQANFHMASENRPQRNLADAWRCTKEAVDRGATEIRIRPYKQEGRAEGLPEGASSPRSTSSPSPTPVQEGEEALVEKARRVVLAGDICDATPLGTTRRHVESMRWEATQQIDVVEICRAFIAQHEANDPFRIAQIINAELPYSSPWEEADSGRQALCLSIARALKEGGREEALDPRPQILLRSTGSGR